MGEEAVAVVAAAALVARHRQEKAFHTSAVKVKDMTIGPGQEIPTRVAGSVTTATD